MMAVKTAEQAISERLRDINKLVHDVNRQRQSNEPNLVAIQKFQEKHSEDKGQSVQHKLKQMITTSLNDAGQEEALIREALKKVQEIRSIRNERRIQARNAGNKETIRRGALMKMLQISAQTLPLFVSRPGEKVPPLCGRIQADHATYVAKPGDMVAALVKGLEEDENWILAEVVQFLPGVNKYEVDDIDEEQKDRHILSKRKIIPLPLMRANPETDGHALFPKGTTVMALYPRTTCFYKAIVNSLPERATDEYEVVFEDQNYPDGYAPPLNVAQRYVIAIKTNKKLSGS